MSRSYYHHCTLTGTVIAVNNIDGANFLLRTRAKDDFYVYITGETYFKSLKNLDERPENSRDRYAPFVGDWGKLTLEQKVAHYVALGALVTVEGVLAINELKRRVDARTVHLLYQQDNVPISEKKGSFAFEGGHWWLSQIGAMADGWLHSLWPNESDNFDFDSYLTNLDMTFRPTGDKSQESATLSRLIYGLSSAFLLTGVERYYASAKAGVEFLRKNFRTTTNEGDHVLWFTKRVNGVSMMEPTSGEDQGSIPLYEQIYCLAGLTQYYRITQDWGVLDDIIKTVTAFQRFWYDTSQYGGWFSHLDYATLCPKSDYLRANNATKNWNSIGDHIPAYLLNLLLALDPLPEKIDNAYMQNFVQVLRKILRESTMLIVEKFPEEGVDYVQERFFQDWTRDKTHTWQQNRAIVGHNLKIAWNLTRVANYYDRNPDDGVNLEKIMAVAEKLALTMVKIGAVDLHRGGCYDAVERIPKNNQSLDFAWMNTKDFWQQEQGILAYYILYGRTHKNEYLDYARDMTSFWNVFFLDQDNKAAYFRTTDDGLPFIKDGYGAKAGHSIAGYHSFELNFLVHIYIMTYVRNKQFCLYFRPSFKSINVAPDGFPGSMNLKITKCLWNGIELGNSSQNFTVKIPDGEFIGGGHERTLSVQFTPVVAHKPSRSLISEGISFTNLSLKPVTKGKIGVIVESHFDETEVRRFEEVFPEQGYEVEYISYLWNQKFLFFTGNDHNDPLYVSKDITTVNPDEYLGFVFIGGYAMDRLRYEADPIKGKPNHSPTVEFLRKVVNIPRLKIGAICHSLWVFCAAKETLAQRQVTCANNILYDVLNAGGVPIYNPNGVGMVPTFVDKKEGSAVLITGQHPGVVEEFVKVYLAELAK